jgi:hypothetical protein
MQNVLQTGSENGQRRSVKRYLIRLWVHECEDGLLPETIVEADTPLEAAAVALGQFEAMGRLVTPDGYLECEPRCETHLRVRHVMSWRESPIGAAVLRRHERAPIQC